MAARPGSTQGREEEMVVAGEGDAPAATTRIDSVEYFEEYDRLSFEMAMARERSQRRSGSEAYGPCPQSTTRKLVRSACSWGTATYTERVA